MINPTEKIVAILAQYAATRTPISSSTLLSDLDIDLLDLPMVILDIEDAFHICIRHEDYECVATVRELAVCVVATLQRSVREVRQMALTPRVKRTWLSTGAERCE